MQKIDERDIKEIQYLKSRGDGTFDIVPKEQADVVKITLQDGTVLWAFPTN